MKVCWFLIIEKKKICFSIVLFIDSGKFEIVFLWKKERRNCVCCDIDFVVFIVKLLWGYLGGGDLFIKWLEMLVGKLK